MASAAELWQRVTSRLSGEPVRIERVEVIPYALPFREPYVTARGTLEARELVLVRVHGGGEVGLGEAVPMTLRGGAGLRQVVADLEDRCRPALEGSDLSQDPSGRLDVCTAAGAAPPALAAIELALLDLAAKRAECPVSRLLAHDAGEAGEAKPVRCNATLSAGAVDRLTRQAAEWAERGFDSFKVKVGGGDDRERVLAVRAAVGSKSKIRIDANGAWEEAEAIRKLRDLEALKIELAEQPVATLEQMARVRRETGTPVAADESLATREDAIRAASISACDAATVKLAKVGGVRAAFEIAEAVPVYLSSALDGPVGIAAAGHVAQTLPRHGFASDLAQGLATSRLFADTIAARECSIANGCLELPQGAGWGVEIDEAAVARRRL
jgi:L-alanine-DL-glutamate epimerase-like enolase superfamily enzyme